MTIRQEEYTALGDFIKTSFKRDQAVIRTRYPKLDEAFLEAFSVKLEQVKTMETKAVVSSALKDASKSLYQEAKALSNELTFVADYFEAAGMESKIISSLKKDLRTYNVEGAVAKIESVLQLMASNEAALTEEGMAADFASTLAAHKVSLASKNALQNQYLDSRKGITESGASHLEELYDYISKIANAGKKVFKGKAAEDEYSVVKIIQRMRATTGQ